MNNSRKSSLLQYYYLTRDVCSCPMRKFRIPMASLEDSHNVKRVEEDRTIAIEAAIVRIMKVSVVVTQLMVELLMLIVGS